MSNFGKTAVVTFAGMTASFLAQLIIDKIEARNKKKELLSKNSSNISNP